jgi:hypothetical protein
MSLGSIARAALGDSFFKLARYYRAIFVDLDAVASILSDELPQGVTVLDVGGGDGAPLNHLLRLRPDLEISMLDISGSIGAAIDRDLEHRVKRFPKTPMAKYDGPAPDVIMISYVLHHVPVADRDAFFRDLAELVDYHRVQRVVVVEVQPGHIRSVLGWLSDRYVSGDRDVSLISAESAVARLKAALPGCAVRETSLRQEDAPNYCLVAQVGAATNG